MSSLISDAEKTRFHILHKADTIILGDAKASFLTLIRSMVLGTDFAAVVT